MRFAEAFDREAFEKGIEDRCVLEIERSLDVVVERRKRGESVG